MAPTLRARIFLTQAPLLVLLLLLGGAGGALLQHLSGRINVILRENYRSVMAMAGLNEAMERIDSSFQFTLAGREAAARKQYQDNWRLYRENLRIEQNNITIPGERELVQRLVELTERYQQQGDAFYARPADGELRRAAYFDPAGLLDSFKAIKTVSGQILRINQDHMEQASLRARRTATASQVGFGVGLAIALVLAALSSWRTTRTLLEPIQSVTRSALDISAGKLDQLIVYPLDDELGQMAEAFSHMARDLRAADKEGHERTALLVRANEVLKTEIRERREAEAEIRKLARRQAAVAELGLRALRRAPLSEVLDSAVTELAQALGVDYANVVEVLPGGDELLLRAGFGWKEGRVGRVTIPSEGTQSGYVVRSQQPVLIEDAAKETRFTPLGKLLGEEVQSGMAVVIATQEGPFGALGAHSRRKRTFTADEVNFLQAVANVLGSTIEHYRDAARLQRNNRALRALGRCNEALIRAADEGALLQQICEIIIQDAGYRLCWVGYRENDDARSVRAVAHAGFEAGYLAALNITWADTERGRGPTGTSIRERRTVVVKDIVTEPTMAPWRVEALKRGYASSLVLPLLINNSQEVGALSIYAAEPNAFNSEEIGLLTEFAADLAFGITALRTRSARDRAEAELRTLNAELEQRVTARTAELQAAGAKLVEAREREIVLGYRIQQMLLFAEPPRDIPGLRVAALSIPSERIDGDFYDFIRRGSRCLDLIVADVMGKGIPAALLGAATKSYFLEAASQLAVVPEGGRLAEPCEIVTLAQAEMARQLISLESFVTLCYARLDLDRLRLDFVDCGHTGFVHFRSGTCRCELVRGDNLPLGFREGEICDQVTLSVAPGDVLVFFSDGVTEARNSAGEFFGTARLLSCVRGNSQLDPDSLVEAIRREVIAFSGTDPLGDDLTCVALLLEARPPSLACAELEFRSEPGELRRVREFVRGFCGTLAGAPLDMDSVASLELAISEAASNIMRHAYQGRTDQWIKLAAEAVPGQVMMRLHHLGPSFDPSEVPLPAFDGSRESGFGIYLIAKSVDEVRYYRDERGRNCIALTKRFRRQP